MWSTLADPGRKVKVAPPGIIQHHQVRPYVLKNAFQAPNERRRSKKVRRRWTCERTLAGRRKTGPWLTQPEPFTFGAQEEAPLRDDLIAGDDP